MQMKCARYSGHMHPHGISGGRYSMILDVCSVTLDVVKLLSKVVCKFALPVVV